MNSLKKYLSQETSLNRSYISYSKIIKFS